MKPEACAAIILSAIGFLVWLAGLAFVAWFVTTIVKWAWGA